MTKFQWEVVIHFTETLSFATRTRDEILQKLGMETCERILEFHPYIPTNLYSRNEETNALQPTPRAIGFTQAMRSAPGNVIIPSNVYADNKAYADDILHYRKSTDDRLELLGEMARLIRLHKDFPDYSEQLKECIFQLAFLQQEMMPTASYKQLEAEVKANAAEDLPQE